MAGLGKLLKQMQKVQTQMQDLQGELESTILEVNSGGAVKVKITGSGKVTAIQIDPELLKEEKSVVEETLLTAMNEAVEKAKEHSNGKMGALTSGLDMPGLM